MSRPSRAGPIGGECERFDPFQLRAPVGELVLHGARREPGALPGGPIGILHRELRERALVAPAVSAVEEAELAHEQAHGPAIRRNVMHGHEEQVSHRFQTEQARAQQRPAG